MTEQELRALVRDVLQRGARLSPLQADRDVPGVRLRPDLHASHATFLLPTGAEGGGPCVIEPAVACTHCGYCQSYGH